MGNIVNYLKQIITSEKGKDVRQSMHDAIKQVYDDAATGGNANMEVTFARGTENTLNDRLTKMDQVAETTTAELAHIEKKSLVIENDSRELNLIINQNLNGYSTFILNDSQILNSIPITLPSGTGIIVIDNSDYDALLFDLPLNASATVIKSSNGTMRSYYGGNMLDGTVKTLDNSFEFTNRNYNLENIFKNVDDFDLPSGYYRVLDKDNYEGTLPDSYGLLIVYRINNSISSQMFIKEGIVYSRDYLINKWSEWLKVNRHKENISTPSVTLNDKIKDGDYYITNTIASSQVPPGLNGTNHLLKVDGNDRYILQKLITMRNAIDKFPSEYTRFSINKGVTWSPWRNPDEGDWTYCYQKNVDFNSIIEKNTYRVNTNGYTATNTPPSYTGFGVLIVYGADSYIVQRLLQNDGSEFSRFSNTNGSEWTAWKGVHEGDWTKCYQKNIDFNAVIEKGNYRVNTSGYTAANAPPQYTGFGVLEVVGAGGYVVQRITLHDGNRFSRFSNDNGNNWTTWS